MENSQVILPFVCFAARPVSHVAQRFTYVSVNHIYACIKMLPRGPCVMSAATNECVHGLFHQYTEWGGTAALFSREPFAGAVAVASYHQATLLSEQFTPVQFCNSLTLVLINE